MESVCVFCGSSFGTDPEFRQAAGRLGEVLADRKIDLVYGGGKVGLMGVIARSALERGGRVIGVIPESLMRRELAYEECTELKVVATMHERKAAMMELAGGFIALPGGFGTLEELFEALTWLQLGIHTKPSGLLNVSGYFDRLLAFLDHAVGSSFVLAEHREMIPVSNDPDELVSALERFELPRVDKVKWARENAIDHSREG